MPGRSNSLGFLRDKVKKFFLVDPELMIKEYGIWKASDEISGQ